jgi:hypothetical protein
VGPQIHEGTYVSASEVWSVARGWQNVRKTPAVAGRSSNIQSEVPNIGDYIATELLVGGFQNLANF